MSIKQKLAIVLTHAKEQNKWVAVAHLAPYGLHTTLVHQLEDEGYIMHEKINGISCIKLTTKGYRHFRQIKEEVK